MSELPPNVRRPSPDTIREKAAEHFLDLSDEEVEAFAELIDGTLESYERLDALTEPRHETEYTDRELGYRPDPDEDPYNAWVTKCSVPGDDDGPLAGEEIGLKDNISVAGVEMTVGSKALEGYIPSRDATVVSRLLDAGATISGKTNMENIMFGGSGDLSGFGPPRNPHNTAHAAGGSSSGSAVALVAGEVDLALGGDQGGSIRMPAAFSGCVGLKATHSLVPYTGVMGLGYTFDHVGPMAMSVENCARMLDVIAGKDAMDPRQGVVTTQDYEAALEDDPDGVSVGVLEEGFGWETSTDGVETTVRDALSEFSSEGATLSDVSIPEHLDGIPIWNGVAIEETTATVRDEGVGAYGKGFYDTDFASAFAKARRTRAEDFPPTLKLTLVLGEYLSDEYQSHYYAKSQNLRRKLTAAYDRALEDHDVIAMPTVPHTAHPIEEDVSVLEIVEKGLTMIQNTAPFDISGHPAITVPCGMSDGLPVGLMFVGERFDDASVLRAAKAFEASVYEAETVE